MQLHASCAARDVHGVLLLGPPGSGKSDLLLRLLDRGFALVADDRVEVEDGVARAPAALAGLVEVRGLGILSLPCQAEARLALAVTRGPGERLPPPRRLQLGPTRLLAGVGGAARSVGARLRAGPPAPARGSLRVTDRRQRVVLVTGLSGAGKISILRALEDLGYEAVDNPPLDLLASLVERGGKPLAIGVDARSRGFDAAVVLAVLAALRRNPALRAELVYAWASEEALLRRYTESRRRHPLAPEGRVTDGIQAETSITEQLRDAADLVLDTSNLALPDLRRRIGEHFGATAAGTELASLTVSLVSFAFRAGLPREADMVFDARFLRNPHYDAILRPRTGLDGDVAAYIQADPDFTAFMAKVETLLDLVLPRFVTEGKRYVTVAVGCTGGQHRSVHIVELLAAHLRALSESGVEKGWQVTVTHREIASANASRAQPAAGQGA